LTVEEILARTHRPGRPLSAAGSRARSREIGYAEAMADISHLLRAEARKWKNSADAQIIPLAEAALKVAASSLQELADYAHSVAQVHGTEHAMPIGELLINVMWHSSSQRPVPREVPQHSDN
jgi:hypothetical protein